MSIKKAKIVHIDALSGVCGYFTTQTDANSHYGCNHPEQEDFEMCYRDNSGYTHRYDREPKVKQGKCYDFCCPLAHMCDILDVKKYDPELLKDYPNAPDDYLIDDYVVYYKLDENDKIFDKL